MLALILILFEGGLELRLKEAIRYGPGGVLLAVVGYTLTLGLVAVIVRVSLHLQWMDGVLILITNSFCRRSRGTVEARTCRSPHPGSNEFDSRYTGNSRARDSPIAGRLAPSWANLTPSAFPTDRAGAAPPAGERSRPPPEGR